MLPEDRIRLQHMLEAAVQARQFTHGRDPSHLESDRMLLFALVKCLEIIGKAAGKVSAETRRHSPAIPWRNMAAMRNRLIHAYFDVDPEVVRQTVEAELPKLIEDLQALLQA